MCSLKIGSASFRMRLARNPPSAIVASVLWIFVAPRYTTAGVLGLSRRSTRTSSRCAVRAVVLSISICSAVNPVLLAILDWRHEAAYMAEIIRRESVRAEGQLEASTHWACRGGWRCAARCLPQAMR